MVAAFILNRVPSKSIAYTPYEDTFSPIVRFSFIRLILLVIVASMNLKLHQMNIKATFFNGELDEEIYMEQPLGFI